MAPASSLLTAPSSNTGLYVASLPSSSTESSAAAYDVRYSRASSTVWAARCQEDDVAISVLNKAIVAGADLRKQHEISSRNSNTYAYRKWSTGIAFSRRNLN
ncbi:hypothetical protein BN1723_010898 [Verticillium longisporum]|uniref:Uncharacterized protein n=1 Tax=Verticillium longisporum TaxID=100787 RepID=A0A0G4L365_VERLO|nr:hypothetical protein BN1708_009834 [Verticillium longisporum]CRK16215.1 hypothetical protein BN1723_010898 [Verticillium longisporum]